jgi:hypothetical protein
MGQWVGRGLGNHLISHVHLISLSPTTPALVVVVGAHD